MKTLPLLPLLVLVSLACSLLASPPAGWDGDAPTEAATLPALFSAAGERPCVPPEKIPAIPDPNGPSFHQVFIATSSDGLTWQTNNQVIIDQASVPEGVRLPDGRWLIYAVNGSTLGSPGLVYAESQDEGRTWTCGTVNVPGADPDVVLLPDGRMRIYYIEFPFGPHPPQPGTPPSKPNRVRSAVSSDGKNFTIESGTRLEGVHYTDPDVILVGSEWFMYVSTGEKAWAARSSDGLNFTLLGLVNATGAVSGSYLFPDGTLRHYYCGRDGIHSATSSSGAAVWRTEPGTRIARDPAWKIVCDPSVASDGYGGYWMAYKIQPIATTATSQETPVSSPPTPPVLPPQEGGRRENAPTPTQADITYCVVDGVELKMDLYSPASIDAPLPVTVYVHGGGWTGGDKRSGEGIRDIPDLLARGYLVAAVNYRLAPRYKFPAMIEDVKCAVRFLRAHAERFSINPQKIGAWGGSAGGHLVALLGTADATAGWEVGQYLEQSSRIQAVVDMFGPTDLTVLFEGANPRLMEQVFGTSDRNSETLKRASPVSWVSSDDPPFLILHGERDPLVPVSQSQLLYEKLQAAGVPATLVIVKNAGHGFAPMGGPISPSRQELTKMIGDFFDQYLK